MCKPLLAAGRSEDNAQGWKIFRNMNRWPRSKASRATVKFWASRKGVYLFYNPLNNFSRRTHVDPSYIFCGLSLRSITILRFVSRDQFYPMRARRNYSVGYQCIHIFFFFACIVVAIKRISAEVLNWWTDSSRVYVFVYLHLLTHLSQRLLNIWFCFEEMPSSFALVKYGEFSRITK